MNYPAYQPREDCAVSVAYRGDCRPGLACEDRDLVAEAEDQDAALLCIAEVLTALYPPRILAGVTFPTNTN